MRQFPCKIGYEAWITVKRLERGVERCQEVPPRPCPYERNTRRVFSTSSVRRVLPEPGENSVLHVDFDNSGSYLLLAVKLVFVKEMKVEKLAFCKDWVLL